MAGTVRLQGRHWQRRDTPKSGERVTKDSLTKNIFG